jgi:hypothetical protein
LLARPQPGDEQSKLLSRSRATSKASFNKQSKLLPISPGQRALNGSINRLY